MSTATPAAAALRRVSPSATDAEVLQILEEDGAVVAEGMFPLETVATMRDAVLARAARDAGHVAKPGSATQGIKSGWLKDFVGANTVRFSSLGVLCSRAFFRMLDNSFFRALADATLLPHCGSYWLNTGQVPGSHCWEDYARKPKSHEITVAEMQPGDALIYLGSVLHGGGANITQDRWRNAMHLSFVVGWLTPEEAHPLDFNSVDLARESKFVQQVLGHRSYDPVASPHSPYYSPRKDAREKPVFVGRVEQKGIAPVSGAGGGLWLRHVRAIEDCAESQDFAKL